MNKIILIGNVGGDPEVRTLESGVTVAKVTLATSERWNDKEGNKQEKTDWHNVIFWRGLATTVSNYVKKGSKICVVGKVETRSYEDTNGVKKYTTEVIARELELLSKKEGSGANFPTANDEPPQSQKPNQKAKPNTTSNPSSGGGGDDDLPF